MEKYERYKDTGIDWIGKIPEYWEVKRLKYIAYFQRGFDLSSGNFISGKIPVYGSNGIIGYHNEATTKAPSITIGRSGSVGEVNLIKNNYWAHNTALFLLENFHNDIYFLYYLLISLDLKSESSGTAVGTLNRNLIHQIKVGLPPLEEQKTIARYLDRKTAEIDRLIAQKERLIELYEEEKTAIINQVVTKGINPDVKLKPSDINWLGDIPEDWEIKKLKYVSKILRGKFTHRPRNDERLYGGKYPFIQTGEVTNAEKQIIGYRQTLNDKGFSVSQQFPKGTLVMTIAANIGDVAILDFDACFPDSIVGFFPKEIIFVDFLYYKFIALRNILLGLATQNTQQNLNIERISPVEISFPPLKEQQAIADYIKTECDRIDAKIAKTKRIIELQKEYRTALISEAVTGKIKVPQLL